jgi:hypothetical protein
MTAAPRSPATIPCPPTSSPVLSLSSPRTQGCSKSGEPLTPCLNFLRRSVIRHLPNRLPAWSGWFRHLHPAMDGTIPRALAQGTTSRQDRRNLGGGSIFCGAAVAAAGRLLMLQLALWFWRPGCVARQATSESVDAICQMCVARPWAHAGVVCLVRKMGASAVEPI